METSKKEADLGGWVREEGPGRELDREGALLAEGDGLELRAGELSRLIWGRSAGASSSGLGGGR